MPCEVRPPGGQVPTSRTVPESPEQIIAAAKASFLDGDTLAYACGIVIVLIGAVLVFVCFPKRDRELGLLAIYAAEDAAVGVGQLPT